MSLSQQIYIALKPLRTKRAEYKVGDKIEILNEDIAKPLIEQGLIKSFTHDDAEKLDWCLNVCMLTPGQRKFCERQKPCPKEVDYGKR